MPELDATLFDIESIVHRRDRSRIDDLVSVLETDSDRFVIRVAAWALERLDVRSAVPGMSAELMRRGTATRKGSS